MKELIKSYSGMAIALGNKEYYSFVQQLWEDMDITKEEFENLKMQRSFCAYGNSIYPNHTDTDFSTNKLTIVNHIPKDDISVYIPEPFYYNKPNYGM